MIIVTGIEELLHVGVVISRSSSLLDDQMFCHIPNAMQNKKLDRSEEKPVLSHTNMTI